MPRISTTSLAQHRDWRRNQLIEAAAAIALESGGEAVTVAAVAQRAGLSRTSVYEYFASSSDLIADLIIDELRTFSLTLEEAIAGISEPTDAIEQWITTSLIYVADGRHLLAKALNSNSAAARKKCRDWYSSPPLALFPYSEPTGFRCYRYPSGAFAYSSCHGCCDKAH